MTISWKKQLCAFMVCVGLVFAPIQQAQAWTFSGIVKGAAVATLGYLASALPVALAAVNDTTTATTTTAAEVSAYIAAVGSAVTVLGALIALTAKYCSKSCWLNCFDICGQCRQRCSGGIKYHPLLTMMQQDLDGDLLLMFDKFGRALDENAKQLGAKAQTHVDVATGSHIYAFPTQAICITNLQDPRNRDLLLKKEERYLQAQATSGPGKLSLADIKEALSLGANDTPGRLEKQYMKYAYEHLATWVKEGKIVYYTNETTGEFIFYIGDSHERGFKPYARVVMVQQATQVASADNTQALQDEFTKRLTGNYWALKTEFRVEAAEAKAQELLQQRPDVYLQRTAANIPVGEIWESLDQEAQTAVLRAVAEIMHLDVADVAATLAQSAPLARTRPLAASSAASHHAAAADVPLLPALPRSPVATAATPDDVVVDMSDVRASASFRRPMPRRAASPTAAECGVLPAAAQSADSLHRVPTRRDHLGDRDDDAV